MDANQHAFMKRWASACLCIAILVGCCRQTQAQYTADWSSLRKHNTPEWLDGMKFGIYCHWGPQTIQLAHPEEDLETLDAIDKWTGENFSAKAWVDVFESAGAQFAGPVAWHGSGVLNWYSILTDWNSVKRGPKVDIFGELAKEIRKRDMKLIASFHSCRSDAVWGPMSKENPIYLDPAIDNSQLTFSDKGRMSRDCMIGWLQRIQEAIDTYQPDMIWLDTSFGGTVSGELNGHFDEGRLLDGGDNTVGGVSEEIQQRMISHYFNKGLQWGREVELIYKSHDVPPGVGMRDIENGNLTGLQYDPWMADINIVHHHFWPSTWFYNPKNPPKDANTLVDMLVDITSKNGRILLSVPPLPDGTFSPEIRHELAELGNWLKVNGEAIYGTIPWVFYGEGPTTVLHPGHHGQGKNRGTEMAQFNEQDIRFTQKGDTLYAICLGWPGQELAIRTLGYNGKLYPGEIQKISLLGTEENISWEQTGDALLVRFPDSKPCKYAYALKIQR